MKQLPDDRTMDELLELARDAYEKARIMYEAATEIAKTWERWERDKQAAIQQTGKTE